MTRVVVCESTVGDIYDLAANLRSEDRSEILAFGLDPREAIRRSYRHAIMRKTALVDGEIAAMWGLGGAMLSDEGAPWLMTTPRIEKIPMTFVKISKVQVDEMLKHRRFLCNYVLATYRRACRLLEVLDFVLDPPVPMGPQGLPFRRFWMER